MSDAAEPIVKVQIGYLCVKCRGQFLVKCPENAADAGRRTIQVYLEAMGWRNSRGGWKCGECRGIRGNPELKLEGMPAGAVPVAFDRETGRILDPEQAQRPEPKPFPADEIRRILRAVKFTYSTEKELQGGIERVLHAAGVAFERERRLAGDAGVIDFLVGRVGIEVKTKGSPSQVARQLIRYCKADEVDEIILVTGRVVLGELPAELAGKKVYVLALWGSFL